MKLSLAFAVGLLSVSAIAQENGQQQSISGFITKYPVQFSGSIRFRQEDHQYTDLARVRSFGILRARMEFAIKPPEEDWSVFIQPQFSKVYGERYFSGTSTTANQAVNSSGNTADTPVMFHQAFFNYKPTKQLQFNVGREELSYGNELILGKLNWGNVGRSFDTIRMKYSNDYLWSDLFVAKVVDTNTNIATAQNRGDRDLYGSYSSTTKLPFIDTADFYFLYLKDRDVTSNYNIFTAGTRLLTKVKKADFRVEANRQSVDTESSQIDGEIGFTFDEQKKFRMAVAGMIAEADYEHYYPGWHGWLGYADLLGRKNIKSAIIHTSYQATEKLNLLLSAHRFWRVDTNAPAYKTNTAGNWGTKSNASDLGTEIDLTVAYKIEKGPQIRAGVSHYFLGQYFTDQYINKNPWFSYLEMEVRF